MVEAPTNTPTERYLAGLGRRSFLRLWSYTGVYRDQGIGARHEGAELCDLFVVFDNNVVIFSDKSCEYPDVHDADVAWRRWYKKAIRRSADQVWGAERWLKEHPGRIFMDRACLMPFPVNLPDMASARFHRIVVAHDPSGRRRQGAGGSGSLRLDSSIRGSDHERSASQGGRHFTIGNVGPPRGFVHVLDDVTLDVVMRTFDTAPDFIAYLAAKEALFLSGRIAGALGEEQLVAHYLANVDERGQRTFDVSAGQAARFDRDAWGDLLSSPAYAKKLAADRISYFWDQVIDEVAQHAVDGTLQFTNAPGARAQEEMLRAMAAEPRLSRRILSRSLRDVVLSAERDMPRIRWHGPFGAGPYYVFMAWGPTSWDGGPGSVDEFREYRGQLLTDYCTALAAKAGETSHVIGIATECGESEARSWEVAVVRGRDLSADDRVEALATAERRDWLKNQLKHSNFETDFGGPEKALPPRMGSTLAIASVGRNDPCPCGSGKKSKKCHFK
jgi:hypothetical protein